MPTSLVHVLKSSILGEECGNDTLISAKQAVNTLRHLTQKMKR